MRRVLRVRVSAAQPARCCWHDPSAGELDTPTHAATSDSELGVRRRYRDSAGGPGRATPTTRSAQLLTPAPSSGTLRTRARAAGPRRSGSRDRREARLRESGREAGRSPRPAHPAVVETDRTSARATRVRRVVARASSPTVDAPRHLHRTRSFTFADFKDHAPRRWVARRTGPQAQLRN